MFSACDGFVRIRRGKWEAGILPEFGMNAVSLRYDGREILRKPESTDALSKSPYLYGIPLLFPANRVAGGTFDFMGKTYALPLNEPQRNNHIHGLMYNAPFEIVDQSDRHIEAAYENRGERYPFPFFMKMTDELSESGYTRKVYITNTGNTPLPYTLAFHTTFLEPSRLTVFVKERFLLNENYIPTGRLVPLTECEKRYSGGISLKDYALSGFYVSGGNSAYLDDICFTVSDNFDEWILFNAGGGQGFVCVEPQAGEVNGLNRQNGSKILKEGETHMFTLSITREEKS